MNAASAALRAYDKIQEYQLGDRVYVECHRHGAVGEVVALNNSWPNWYIVEYADGKRYSFEPDDIRRELLFV